MYAARPWERTGCDSIIVRYFSEHEAAGANVSGRKCGFERKSAPSGVGGYECALA